MPVAHAPHRALFVRPDTYGDLVLFEPVLRAARAAWPEAEVAVLVREPYADIAPLLPAGVRWLTTRCQPYRRLPTDPAEAGSLAELRRTVGEFAPDLVVAGASAPTWLEFAAAAAAPAGSARVRLGSQALDPSAARALRELAIPEDSFHSVEVPADAPEGEKNAALAAGLLGRADKLPAPRVSIPADAFAEARAFLAAAGLAEGRFLAVAPAGTANVPIKAWPPDRFGALVGWAEKERALPALLVGARDESGTLEAVRTAATAAGARDTVVYAGEPGKIVLLATLLSLAHGFAGNDTGALHLAVAAGRPAVGVYGGGTWPRFIPKASEPFAAVVQPLPCFGCGWDCIFGDAPCLRLIPVEPVRAALAAVLDGESPGVSEVRILDEPALGRIDEAARRVRSLRADGLQRLRQVGELTATLRTAEADRAARGAQVEELTALARAKEEEYQSRGAQIEKLTATLRTAEADRAARGAQVEELTVLVQAKEGEFKSRGAQVEQLTSLVRTKEEECQSRGAQVEQLATLLRSCEEDRLARAVQIEQLTGLVHGRDEEFASRGRQIETLTGQLQAAEADRAARGAQVEQLATLGRETLAGREEAVAKLEETGIERDEERVRHTETRERMQLALRQEGWLRDENRRLHGELGLARRVLRALAGEPPAPAGNGTAPPTKASKPRGWTAWLGPIWRRMRP